MRGARAKRRLQCDTLDSARVLAMALTRAKGRALGVGGLEGKDERERVSAGLGVAQAERRPGEGVQQLRSAPAGSTSGWQT